LVFIFPSPPPWFKDFDKILQSIKFIKPIMFPLSKVEQDLNQFRRISLRLYNYITNQRRRCPVLRTFPDISLIYTSVLPCQLGQTRKLWQDIFFVRITRELNTGQFISPSGNSDFCGTVAGMVTPKGSMQTEEETLQVYVLPYRSYLTYVHPCDAADINPVIKFLPHMLQHLAVDSSDLNCNVCGRNLITGLTSVASQGWTYRAPYY
jgi:hypothetical protein